MSFTANYESVGMDVLKYRMGGDRCCNVTFLGFKITYGSKYNKITTGTGLSLVTVKSSNPDRPKRSFLISEKEIPQIRTMTIKNGYNHTDALWYEGDDGHPRMGTRVWEVSVRSSNGERVSWSSKHKPMSVDIRAMDGGVYTYNTVNIGDMVPSLFYDTPAIKSDRVGYTHVCQYSSRDLHEGLSEMADSFYTFADCISSCDDGLGVQLRTEMEFYDVGSDSYDNLRRIVHCATPLLALALMNGLAGGDDFASHLLSPQGIQISHELARELNPAVCSACLDREYLGDLSKCTPSKFEVFPDHDAQRVGFYIRQQLAAARSVITKRIKTCICADPVNYILLPPVAGHIRENDPDNEVMTPICDNPC